VADDRDGFDDLCRHVRVADTSDDTVVATFRVMPLCDGSDIANSYAAQFYCLDALSSYRQPMAELGRFCVDPDRHDPDILRVAWQELARFVDDEKVGMLFGCSSFKGTDPGRWRRSFSMLSQKYLGPKYRLPTKRARSVVDLEVSGQVKENFSAHDIKELPAILHLYLTLGGWVSDHAVIDRDLDTIHVFTGLEIAGIPPRRARFLRGE